MSRQFIPGLELARRFYHEEMAPLLVNVTHGAALVGWGSEVIGFDTERSTDHGWGPRLQIFVEPDLVPSVRQAVEGGLPEEFCGWPTRFGWDDVPASNHIDVVPLREWLQERLSFDPRDGVAIRDWLATPQQRLLEVTAGAVFHDDGGELAAVRRAVAWYPDDVWLWLLACQWRRLDQEEPFVGRAAEVGDELGSRVIAARLVRDLMRLAFLLERRYAPYSKWLGSAFAQLDVSTALRSALLDVLAATDFARRETALVSAFEELAARHNASGLTRPVEGTVRLFHTRPFRVLGSARFVDACLERVADQWLRALPLVGSVDQFVDSVEVLSEPTAFGSVDMLFDSWASRSVRSG